MRSIMYASCALVGSEVFRCTTSVTKTSRRPSAVMVVLDSCSMQCVPATINGSSNELAMERAPCGGSASRPGGKAYEIDAQMSSTIVCRLLATGRSGPGLILRDCGATCIIARRSKASCKRCSMIQQVRQRFQQSTACAEVYSCRALLQEQRDLRSVVTR